MAREPQKPDKPARKVFGPKDDGQEAYDFVLAKMQNHGLFGGSGQNMEQCPGFARWREFLRNHRGATLDQCVTEFELSMRRQKVNSWVYVLLEMLADHAYPEFRDRVFGAATPDAAHRILRDRERFKVDDRHVAGLEAKVGQGLTRKAKEAPVHRTTAVITRAGGKR